MYSANPGEGAALGERDAHADVDNVGQAEPLRHREYVEIRIEAGVATAEYLHAVSGGVEYPVRTIDIQPMDRFVTKHRPGEPLNDRARGVETRRGSGMRAA